MANPRPTHEQFNEEYQNKGLQPTYKSQVSYQNGKDDAVSSETEYDTGVGYPSRAMAPRVSYRKRQPTRSKRTIPTKAKLAKKGFSYSRVTFTNISIISWGMTLWWLQFILALISAVALGGLGVYDNLQENSVGEVIITGLEYTYDGIISALNYLGFDDTFPKSDDLKGMLAASILLPAAVGFITLFLASLQYIFLRFRPLFGEGSTIKISAFLVAMIGYFIPIMNIFPWFIFWVLAVWRYPK